MGALSAADCNIIRHSILFCVADMKTDHCKSDPLLLGFGQLSCPPWPPCWNCARAASKAHWERAGIRFGRFAFASNLTRAQVENCARSAKGDWDFGLLPSACIGAVIVLRRVLWRVTYWPPRWQGRERPKPNWLFLIRGTQRYWRSPPRTLAHRDFITTGGRCPGQRWVGDLVKINTLQEMYPVHGEQIGVYLCRFHTAVAQQLGNYFERRAVQHQMEGEGPAQGVRTEGKRQMPTVRDGAVGVG